MPAEAHTDTELDDWMLVWITEADISLNPPMLAEFRDMRDRHSYYFHPTPTRTYRTWKPDVEGWRPLVQQYFPTSQVETAMRVMSCETGGTGNSDSYNSSSGASGLFQHLPKYWADRSAKAGWAGADIFDPTANVAVAAWLQRTGGWQHWTCY